MPQMSSKPSGKYTPADPIINIEYYYVAETKLNRYEHNFPIWTVSLIRTFFDEDCCVREYDCVCKKTKMFLVRGNVAHNYLQHDTR